MFKTYGEKTCAWCPNSFVAGRANQIYCSPECCRKATNDKLLKRYHLNKERKASKPKTCQCGTLLSKYNDSDLCYSCQQRKTEEDRIALLRRLGFEYISE